MSRFRLITENILKQSTLFKEDAKADYALIKEAEVVWKTFVDQAKEDTEIIVDSINNLTGYEYKAQVLDDLIVAIDWEDAKLHHEAGYYAKTDNLIQIHLMNVLYYPYYRYIEKCNITEKQLISVLNSSPVKSVFLHEYQHYKYQTNDKTSLLPYKAKTDDNGQTIYDKYYFTDPNEFNSFTLQDINNAIKIVRRLLADAVRNEGLKPDDKDGIKAIIRHYMKGFYANHYRDIKDRDWHEHVNKRVYNMLYYLFVENNITNAKKIYNSLKKQVIDEPTRVNDILSSLKLKFELMKKEGANITDIYQINKEKCLHVLYKNSDGLDEKIDKIAKDIAKKYLDHIDYKNYHGLDVKTIYIK